MPGGPAVLLIACDGTILQFNLIFDFFLRVWGFSVKAGNIADSTRHFPSDVFPS